MPVGIDIGTPDFAKGRATWLAERRIMMLGAKATDTTTQTTTTA
jgi:hypothetical protein